MNLKNGYKVLYAEAAEGMRTFKASKTGTFADAEIIAEIEMGKYKLIYEKEGKIYGSETGVPSEADISFDAFKSVLNAEEAFENEVVEEEAAVEPVVEEAEEQVIEEVTADPVAEEELPE